LIVLLELELNGLGVASGFGFSTRVSLSPSLTHRVTLTLTLAHTHALALSLSYHLVLFAIEWLQNEHASFFAWLLLCQCAELQCELAALRLPLDLPTTSHLR